MPTFNPNNPYQPGQFPPPPQVPNQAPQPPTGPMPNGPQPAPAPTQYSPTAMSSHQNINSDISLDQWQAWDEFHDPACPPQTPYRSQKMLDGQKANTCEETPDNCPPGTQAFGKNDCRRPGDIPGGGGYGGSAGGAGGGSIFGNPNDFAKLLEGHLRNFLNQPSRYSPQVLQSLFSGIKSQTAHQTAAGEAAARADAARRGMSRSGATGAAVAAARRGAESGALSSYTAIQQAKVNADQEDKVAALDRAQKYLDSLRDNLYRQDLSATQRSQFQANLALAYANIQNSWDRLRAEQGYSALNGAV